MIAWAVLNFVVINVVLMMTNQIVVLFAIFVIPMYVSDSDPHSSEVEIIASTCFITVKSFVLPECRPKQTPMCSNLMLPECRPKQTPVCSNLMLWRMAHGLHMWTVTPVGNNSGSSFLGTNLDRFEPNWILELDCTLVPSLILGSSNQKLSFSHCFLVWNNRFSLQNSCHIDLASIWNFFGLWPSFKGVRNNLKLSTNKIAWIHWTLDLGP